MKYDNVKLWSFKSSSNPDKEYDVLLNVARDNTRWLSCNCPSWTHGTSQRGKQVWERTCKHTDQTLDLNTVDDGAFFNVRNGLRRFLNNESDSLYTNVAYGISVKPYRNTGEFLMIGAILPDTAAIAAQTEARTMTPPTAPAAKAKPRGRFQNLEITTQGE